MASDKWKYQYIRWFKIAQEVLGSNLVRKLDDTDVINWISREHWLMLPLPTEIDMEDAKNRWDPNIYIELWEKNGKEKIGIGLTCNTIKSVEKMQNILDSYHNPERERLLFALKKLDNTFTASVSSKRKENHFAQSPDYDRKLELKSNEIDEKYIKEIFRITTEIRKKGIRLKETWGTSHPIEAPTFQLAYCGFPIDEDIFRKKLQELKPVFEICLHIKKSGELEKEKKKIENSKIVLICEKCRKIVSEQEYSKSKFHSCKNLIRKVKRKYLDSSFKI
jgi:hypothetical protein